MSDVVIRVENLGKKYTIGHAAQAERYTALRDVLTRGMQSVFRKAKDLALGRPIIEGDELEEVWALRDVSFEVKRGEVLGVIGRNGAGKSTLLKILSLITEPSAGRVTIKGRVASLLEVGTGFHPELSGRENIFLNGAILGMDRLEIKRKFDEIVAFAEIEKFLDTPVKRYSSGMYVRLAFAVAAHLESEVLLIDEVLAVGDAQFQRKCLGKVESLASGEGRTILFVSHNMVAVQRLCTRGVLLVDGELSLYGSVAECVERYITSAPAFDSSVALGEIDLTHMRQGNTDSFRFMGIQLLGQSGKALDFVPLGEAFHVRITFELTRPHRELIVGLGVHTSEEYPLFATHNNDFGRTYSLEPGQYSVNLRFSPNYLRQRRYLVSVGAISSGALVAHIPAAMSLSVEPLLKDNEMHFDNRIGALFVPMKWGEVQRVALRT